MTEKEKALLRLYRTELARREFFEFCKVSAPDFYKDNRIYLQELCNTLQGFLSSDKKVLVINMPPRHGKSRTASLFCEWLFGRDKNVKIITASYNEILSQTFSKAVRDTISEIRADKDKIVYNDIFPDTHIKKGDGAKNLWSLEGGYNNYLATSPNGTMTGFGANIIIIDDIIKSAEEANNALTKEGHWEWFTNTLVSRFETGGKLILIMTRWASDDLCGRVLESYSEDEVIHINYKAYDGERMLCDDILSRDEYERRKELTSPEIVAANYDQIPLDIKGCLYTQFKTYDSIPKNDKGEALWTEIVAYCDTADTGSDYLCNIIFGIYNQEAYILDVLYTKEPMEQTEIQVAERLERFEVNNARIEANNGGRSFARAVQGRMKANKTVIRVFTQRKNKNTRILTQSSWVMEHIYYPTGWHNMYPEFYKSLKTYQREGRNAHDDAEDSITGVAETVQLIWKS